MPVAAGIAMTGTSFQSKQLIRQNYEKGMQGEKNAGLTSADKNRVDSLSGTAKYRIADGPKQQKGAPINAITEVKNVNTLRKTPQLSDYAALGDKYKFTPKLIIDNRTKIAPKNSNWFSNNFNIFRLNLNKK